MGKILSVASRPFRDFNLESRAHKAVSREKPIPAPKYKSDQLDYERILREHPDTYQDSLKKNENLNKHLKDVFVTSQDPAPQAPISSSSADRPLPLDRSAVADTEFGFREPQKVPYGKVTLRSAMRFIGQHQADPIENSIVNIANEYKLPEETIKNVVKYFKIYEVYVPEQRRVKTNFAGPVVSRKQVFTHKTQELPAGKNRTDS